MMICQNKHSELLGDSDFTKGWKVPLKYVLIDWSPRTGKATKSDSTTEWVYISGIYLKKKKKPCFLMFLTKEKRLLAGEFPFLSCLFCILYASRTFIGTSFFRLGKISSTVLLKVFSVSLTRISSITYKKANELWLVGNIILSKEYVDIHC